MFSGGILVQDADLRQLQESHLKVATKRAPTPEEKTRPAVCLESLPST